MTLQSVAKKPLRENHAPFNDTRLMKKHLEGLIVFLIVSETFPEPASKFLVECILMGRRCLWENSILNHSNKAPHGERLQKTMKTSSVISSLTLMARYLLLFFVVVVVFVVVVFVVVVFVVVELVLMIIW